MEPINPMFMLIQNQEWAISISQTLEEALKEKNDDEGVVVSIFNVPKALMLSKPEAYTPQVVALGPYHRRRPDLSEMERYKLTSAKRVQRSFRDKTKLSDVVRSFQENDSHVRGCYHRFLQELDKQTLAWTLAVDASFLLECLQTYSVCINKTEYLSGELRLTRVTSKMAHLIDYTRRKTTHHAILRDTVMLENQIPLFLIRELHRFISYNNIDHDHQNYNPDEVLAKMLFAFCKDNSPFKFVDVQNNFRADNIQECYSFLLGKSHLLELLYSVVVPKTLLNMPSTEQNIINTDQDKAQDHEESKENKYWCIKAALTTFLAMLSFVVSAPIFLLEKIHKSKSIKFFLMLPYKVMVRIYCLKAKSSAVNGFVTSAGNLAEEMESIFTEAAPTDDDRPLMEEISIPGVTELVRIGVKFIPENTGGLTAIRFEKASGKFHLPVVHLDDNSEVVLRNLVAYEASSGGVETVAFTRYTELMNGIIDTEEDARVLREAGVVVNRLKSDREVAALWNGMTGSVRMTRVRVLDKAIEEANAYYWGSWRVRMKVTMKKYVFCSWPILAFLAANVLLLLSVLEAGCSAYNCSKWFQNSQN